MTEAFPMPPGRADDRWDAIVIGAGPAGAVSARELARGGARVLLVDKHRFPREKVCGGCLNGHAMGVLRSAGLEGCLRGVDGAPLDSFRLGVRGREFRLDLPRGMAVPRDRFDARLVEAAVAAGAGFLDRTEARLGECDGSIRRVVLGRGPDARSVAAHVVLLASGLNRHDGPGPSVEIARGSRIGAGCCLDPGDPEYAPGIIHMAAGRDGYVGLVRLADGRLHVAAAFRPEALRREGGPGVVASSILVEAGFASPTGLREAGWRGTVALTRRARVIADTRLFLLGDAAGYIEPFTGEGIAWALAAGLAIGPLALRAIERWEPGIARDWRRLHGRVVGRRQRACRIAAALLRRPSLVRALMGALALMPGSAAPVLEYLNAPPRSLGARRPCPP